VIPFVGCACGVWCGGLWCDGEACSEDYSVSQTVSRAVPRVLLRALEHVCMQHAHAQVHAHAMHMHNPSHMRMRMRMHTWAMHMHNPFTCTCTCAGAGACAWRKFLATVRVCIRRVYDATSGRVPAINAVVVYVLLLK